MEERVKETGRKAIAAGAIGTALILVVLAITFLFRDPDQFQRDVLYVVLALAAAGFAGLLPGAISTNIPRGITAAGSFAVFVIVLVVFFREQFFPRADEGTTIGPPVQVERPVQEVFAPPVGEWVPFAINGGPIELTYHPTRQRVQLPTQANFENALGLRRDPSDPRRIEVHLADGPQYRLGSIDLQAITPNVEEFQVIRIVPGEERIIDGVLLLRIEAKPDYLEFHAERSGDHWQSNDRSLPTVRPADKSLQRTYNTPNGRYFVAVTLSVAPGMPTEPYAEVAIAKLNTPSTSDN